jgi:hypothetical protein
MRRAPRSQLDRNHDRATVRDALPAVAALVCAQLVVAAADLDAQTHRWHLLISLSPVVACVWLAWVVRAMVHRADEYQRTLQLEALGAGFAAAMLTAAAGGALDAIDVGSSSQFLQLTFIVGILVWIVALARGLRR